MDIIRSFSTKGYLYDSVGAESYDNAAEESFFKFLKLEEINRRTYYTKKELEDSLFECIEEFYNSKRSHSANNILSPNQKEKQYTEGLNK